MARVVREVRTPAYVPNGNEIAVIETARGDIRVRLFGKECPATVGNFAQLAASGFYENLTFHAYKPDSVILGGCPKTRGLGPNQVYVATRGALHGVHPGTGDSQYRVVDEWRDNPKNRHRDGSLVMAHKSDENSATCQFYFSLSEQPEFDDKYTVFGETIEGLDVVHALRLGDRIKNVRIEGADEPIPDEWLPIEAPESEEEGEQASESAPEGQ